MQGPQVVKLADNNREREKYDNIADLYSIIKTVEALEKAYVRDAVSFEDYKRQCSRLITQFKTAQNVTREHITDIWKFAAEYKIDNCKAGLHRLLVEPVIVAPTQGPEPHIIAEIVQYFITTMDSLKLNMVAVDQLHPLLDSLFSHLSMISTLPPDWEGKVKLKQWIILLNRMKASDELDQEQARQLLFDLESAYNAFHKSLSLKK
ncbi:hypothetical protein PROFUN_09791 [Planoprotostelium fungivorum]|uniref:Vacuolar protein sorting-associated protein 28 homolog n=1 Tax=Planoprotostelium fungivorum TaxID=1890364 RepID=A0A2P6NGQ9_9EUKA|nr:hypothetical protein PROFUN_09791 [Planoprotostelium fungivorum]